MSRTLWSLRVDRLDLPLAERFTIADASWDVGHNVLVRVGFRGTEGVGEAQPSERFGETTESVIAQLNAVDLARLSSPFELEAGTRLLPPGGARCALDIALHDLAAKLAGVSVGGFLGTAGLPVPPTSVTVPIADVDAMVERARRLSDLPILKIKVGFDGDVKVVEAVRAVYDGTIRVDANQGWTVEEAIARLRELEPLGIEMCEQPIPRGDPDGLRQVRASTSIPIFADEDVWTAADVVSVAGAVDGVNLKLGKTGGLREAMKAVAVARAHGLRLMLGCNLESGIATTAGAHVAGLFDLIDLDAPLLLARDPFPGVAFDRGRLVVPSEPGLGVREVA